MTRELSAYTFPMFDFVFLDTNHQGYRTFLHLELLKGKDGQEHLSRRSPSAWP